MTKRTCKCPQKNISDVLNGNLKNNDQILIVFQMNIPDTTGHERPFNFSPHPKIIKLL